VLPSAVIGFLVDDWCDANLYNYVTVAITLVLYGIAFILVERFKETKYKKDTKLTKNGLAPITYRVEGVEDLTYKDALTIGAFQVLSLIPGTSRSGSTILGGLLTGVSRVASAEFSFFMAIPIMLGASGLKLLKFILSGAQAGGFEIALLLVGILVSFIVSLLVIKLLMSFVKNHSFSAFGIYRIILGVLVLSYFLIF
jgi:undecaprenyl-diphosphatase